MDNDALEDVLRSLQEHRWGWRTTIPNAQFLGKSVGLRVDTQPIPTGGPSPPPDATEILLARLILSNLPSLLAEIEKHFREYADTLGFIHQPHEPHIWLSREMLEEEGTERWSFVIGLADATDWGMHVEFDGLKFQEIWSGD